VDAAGFGWCPSRRQFVQGVGLAGFALLLAFLVEQAGPRPAGPGIDLGITIMFVGAVAFPPSGGWSAALGAARPRGSASPRAPTLGCSIGG
jgi:hypothetical protein